MGLLDRNPHLLGQPAVGDIAVVAKRATPPERVKCGVSGPFPVTQLSICQSAKGLVSALVNADIGVSANDKMQENAEEKM